MWFTWFPLEKKKHKVRIMGGCRAKCKAPLKLRGSEANLVHFFVHVDLMGHSSADHLVKLHWVPV